MIALRLIMIVTIAGILTACGGENKQSAQQASPQVATAQTVSIQLPTIKCQTCARHITAAIKKLDGISDVNVSVDDKKVTVTYAPNKLDQGKIERVIAKSGYDANNVKRDATEYEQLPECCK